ncbi:MAG: sulfite exporter TauE/SafE family protein [Ruminococcaceae bacterium]|nr:sulfite exporter TauE/SafE family protein [Oscillospiraceae bacterium]
MMLLLEGLVPALIAALSGLGIGGGGLLVIYLSAVTSQPHLMLQGTNLLFFIFSSAAASAVNGKKGRIRLRLAAIVSLCGAVGILLGFALLKAIDPVWVKRIFGWLLIVSGLLTLFKKKKKEP